MVNDDEEKFNNVSTSITTGAYILILGTILFSYILGEQIAYKMVSNKTMES